MKDVLAVQMGFLGCLGSVENGSLIRIVISGGLGFGLCSNHWYRYMVNLKFGRFCFLCCWMGRLNYISDCFGLVVCSFFQVTHRLSNFFGN